LNKKPIVCRTMLVTLYAERAPEGAGQDAAGDGRFFYLAIEVPLRRAGPIYAGRMKNREFNACPIKNAGAAPAKVCESARMRYG
jgi:hypothetical protein